MIKKTIEYISLLPLLALTCSIFGYIALSAYLQNYSINDTIEFDTKVIKVGAVGLLFTAPIMIFTLLANPDGLLIAKTQPGKELIPRLFQAYGYTVMYSVILSALLVDFKISYFIILNLYIIILTIINRVKETRIIYYIKFFICQFIPWALLFLCIGIPNLPPIFFLILNHQVLFYCCFTFHFFNKEGVGYQFSRMLSLIIFLIFSVALFGLKTLASIKKQYGGENSKVATYFFKPESDSILRKTILGKEINKGSAQLNCIFENNSRYYFKLPKDKVVSLPKDYVSVVQY